MFHCSIKKSDGPCSIAKFLRVFPIEHGGNSSAMLVYWRVPIIVTWFHGKNPHVRHLCRDIRDGGGSRSALLKSIGTGVDQDVSEALLSLSLNRFWWNLCKKCQHQIIKWYGIPCHFMVVSWYALGMISLWKMLIKSCQGISSPNVSNGIGIFTHVSTLIYQKKSAIHVGSYGISSSFKRGCGSKAAAVTP